MSGIDLATEECHLVWGLIDTVRHETGHPLNLQLVPS